MSRPLQAALAVAILAAVGVGLFLLLGGDGDGGDADSPPTLEGPGFSLEYPDTWEELPEDELARQRGDPLAVLRRDDGSAVLVVREGRRLPQDLDRFARELDRRFEREFRDFRRGQVQVIETKDGEAFSYSYVRTRAGTAHTVILVPAGAGKSFALDVVIQGGADDAARELGPIVRSFDVE